MAVTAKFVADFSNFFDQVNKAEVELKGFEDSATKVSSSLSKMVDGFSGRKILEEGAQITRLFQTTDDLAILTNKELKALGQTASEAAEKMQRMGIGGGEKLQAIADAAKKADTSAEGFGQTLLSLNGILGALGAGLSVGALISFTQEIIASADELTKLHDRTGITVEGLQRFQIAGDDAGNTIQEITRAIVAMEDRLAGGDPSALRALEKLGLSFEDLKRLSPEQQFIAISDAIREIDDPAQQVTLAMDIFGKQGATILPTLKRGFDDVRDASVGMSADTVQALDNVGDAFNRASRQLKGEFAEALNFLFLGWNEHERAAGRFAKQMADVKPPVDQLTMTIQDLTLSEREQRDIERELTESARESIAVNKEREKGIEQVRKKVEEIEKGAKLSAAAIGLQNYEELNAVKKSIAAYDELQKKHKEVDDGLTQLQRDAITTFAVIGQSAAEAEAANKKSADTAAFSYPDAFAKSAAAFEQFKGVVVAGTQTMMNAMLPVLSASDQVTRDWQIQQAQRDRGEIFLTGMSSGRLMVQARASGGPVNSGQPYMVGEKGPELFIPNNSGSIQASGTGGGTQIIQLVVDGKVLADIVNQHNTRSMRQGRQWPSA